jgi:hypothetical protein
MIYIWRIETRLDKRFTRPVVKKTRRAVVHIKHGYLPLPITICGTPVALNQWSTCPPIQSPICKNCLRSCVDERLAA